MDRFKMLTLLALRSMVSHRVKNAIVSIIMIFGTMLVVVGTSVLDSVKLSMQEGITASATGHIQIFSSDAEDDLAIFGQMGAAQDIGELDDFVRIESELRALPGIKDVVPMALGNAVSFGKSELDRVLLDLREREDRGVPSETQRDQISQIALLMLEQNEKAKAVSTDTQRLEEERTIIQKVREPGFWQAFDANPSEGLEFLDTKFAPLSTEGKLLYLRYIATDPAQFSSTFDRFQIVDGEAIPEGQRGVLLSKRFYEKQVKSRLARELDAIVESWREGQRIEGNEVLKNQVSRAARMAPSVLYQLDKDEIAVLDRELEAQGAPRNGSMEERMVRFLTLDDDNIEARYEFFYSTIAPMIDVYDINVGEELVLQSFTKSGYAKSARVKVWGTFNFRGLEGSDLAGAINVLDLATFRTLYGKMSAAQREELNEIRAEAGVEDVAQDDIEASLFGDEGDLESLETADASESEGESVELEIDRAAIAATQRTTYDPEVLRNGVILNAAVILKNPASLESTMSAIKKLNVEKKLGIRAIDWQEASGLVGQFILVISLVLYTAIVIIFTVALVIINNSMVMSTMERIPEIGTIRAIGAQKSTIMLLTLLETTVLCVIAGSIGAALGAGTVSLLGSYGIPAGNDVMTFLFGGPRLYPDFGTSNLLLGFVIILVVSVLSTIYPALVANKVQPAVAMRAKE